MRATDREVLIALRAAVEALTKAVEKLDEVIAIDRDKERQLLQKVIIGLLALVVGILTGRGIDSLPGVGD